jgi:hypothetical protein
VASALSGPAYVAPVQLPIGVGFSASGSPGPGPPSSTPVKTTRTGWLYHPSTSGSRSGWTPVTTGGCLSFLGSARGDPVSNAPNTFMKHTAATSTATRPSSAMAHLPQSKATRADASGGPAAGQREA